MGMPMRCAYIGSSERSYDLSLVVPANMMNGTRSPVSGGTSPVRSARAMIFWRTHVCCCCVSYSNLDRPLVMTNLLMSTLSVSTSAMRALTSSTPPARSFLHRMALSSSFCVSLPMGALSRRLLLVFARA